MRLTTAFFANHAEVVDGMLDVQGAFWKSTGVTPDATGFWCDIVVLCDGEAPDADQRYSLRINAEGPSGRRWTPAYTLDFSLDSPAKFLVLPQTQLPIEPGGGLHVYAFQLDGQHERVDVPLIVHVAPPSPGPAPGAPTQSKKPPAF